MAQIINGTDLDQLSSPSFSYGFFYHEDPLRDTASLLLLQFIVSVLTSRILYFLLRPLRQPRIVCDILGGLFGSSPRILIILSHLHVPAAGRMADSYESTLFRDDVISYTRLLAAYGAMIKFFLIGVKIDPTLAWRSGKRAAILGLCSMVVPFLFLLALQLPFMSLVKIDEEGERVIPNIGDPEVFLHLAATVAATSPSVVADVLADLRLLNTELGRFAVAASMVNEITRWSIFAVYKVIDTARQRHSYTKAIQEVAGMGAFLIALLSLVWPWARWIVRRTPKGGRVAEWHILVMMLAVLTIGALSDALGLGFLDAPMVMGLLVPDGPPLGMVLVEQLELFSTELLLPLFFLTVGYITAFDRITNPIMMLWMLLYILSGHVVKTLVAVVAGLYYKASIHKAAILGLMLNFKGLVELMVYIGVKGDRKFRPQGFVTSLVSIVLVTGVCSWLVTTFYDPLNTRHKVGYRALQHLNPQEKFSTVATMLNEDPVPAMLDLFEASSATPAGQSSACIHVLHLVELSGRANSTLVPHKNRKGELVNPTQMDRLHNAFLNYEKRKKEGVAILPFTAISPYSTMHQDICSLALDKCVPFVIVPFPRFDSSASREIEKAARNIVPQVLSQAPCSVGILVHHALTSSRPLVPEKFRYSVKVLFWGGNDDREALSYAARMARHPGVHMSVARFKQQDQNAAEKDELSWDDVIFKEFARGIAGNERVTVEEVAARDINETMAGIKSIESECDLVMVGREQCAGSMLGEALGKWVESPELGVVGDMLASNDFAKFSFSVLVVQQHG